LIFFPLLTFGQFENKKSYTISQCIIAPKIDGVLNDNTWQDLDIANNFTQISPNNGNPERNHQRTEVKICYDSKNIYFGIMMYDNAPDSILTELAKRDRKDGNSDLFGIFIDPFNDGQIEYELAISAAGVQTDAKITTSSYDNSWDAVWKSAVKINSKGWVVELSIPFSQLRFPDNNKQWSINMARSIRRYREDYSWNPINVEYTNYALQAGLLDGIRDVNSPIRLSFMPYASVYADMYDGEATFPYNYGIDLKYGINESFTLDMTLIPDFGQVAADAMVLNLSPFEVKYEEKRQFFNEGTELFEKGGDMFYSRRLQDDLLNASKVTGRTKNGLGVAVLNAVTNKTDQDPLTNYNIVIFDQAFGNSSSVSLMNTHMVQKGNEKDANVTGVFTRINNKENTHTYVGKLKMSQEFEGSDLTKGFSGMLAVGKTSGNYQYDLYTVLEDDKYNPNDLGFLYSNNEITNGVALSYRQFNENERFVNFASAIEIEHQTLFTDQKFVDFHYQLEAKATLKNYTTIFMRANFNPYEKNDFYEARTNDLLHPLKRSKSISGGGWISTDYRRSIAIDIGGGGALDPLHNGYTYHWRISPRLRLNDNFSMKYVLSIKHKYNDIGFVKNDTAMIMIHPPQIDYIFAKRNTNMITNVLSANYILNNKMDLSVKLRYHMDQVKNLEFKALGDDGYVYESNYIGEHNINYTTWTSDIAFNWWFAPGSQMSLVWKNAIADQENYLRNHWIDNLEESFNLAQQNSISLKVIYYLDYLYLRK
ncbi:MAG: hypothetical protein ACI8ZH_000909, partial [Flavobacteriales bacterium]